MPTSAEIDEWRVSICARLSVAKVDVVLWGKLARPYDAPAAKALMP